VVEPLRGAARDLGERRHGCSLLQALRLLLAAPLQIADARYPPTRALPSLSRDDLVPGLIISSACCFCFLLLCIFFGVLVVRFRVRVFVRGGGTVDLAGIRCAWVVLIGGARAIRILPRLLIWRNLFFLSTARRTRSQDSGLPSV
jgi:hypothetical protein